MDFDLSDDQRALQDAARALLDGRSGPGVVRAVVERDTSVGTGWDRALWAAMVEQGWAAVVVPDELGGLGLGWVEAAVLLEEVGRHVAPAPVLGQVVAGAALAQALAGEEVRHRPGGDQVEGWLAEVAEGERVAAVAGRPLLAVEADGAWRVRGRAEVVPFAPSAALVVAPARDAAGHERLVAVAVEPGRFPAEPAMDRTREVGWVELDGDAAVVLGGPEAVEAHLDRGAVAYAAELLGVAGRALDLAVAYAGDREQFGRPIGSFQAVKHRCADMLVDVEGMRSAVWWAAWCLSADDPDRSVAASTAKAWCSDAGRRVLASALQVHGGIGFTWEHDLHLFLKRGHLDQVAFGDGPAHRARLAAVLRARAEAGVPLV